jgi:hypothetical protein
MNSDDDLHDDSVTGPAQCVRCAKPLPTGSLRYVAEISVTADFDPVLVFPDDMDGEIEHALQAMKDAAEEGLSSKLGELVITRRAFLLCPACREEFLEGLPGELQ